MGLNLEVPIELCEYGMTSATTAYASTYQRINFDSSNYDGATYYFEIVYTNGNTTTNYNVGLRDVTNSSTKVNIQANMNVSARTRARSASFTPASGNNVYAVYSPATASSSQVVVYEARIVVVQSNATKTRIQIPLLNRNYNDSAAYNAQYVDNRNVASLGQSVSRYFPIWKYVAGDWATIPSNGLSFESCVASSNASATATVALRNMTDSSTVVSLTRSSTTPAVVTTQFSTSQANFDDGDNFAMQHQCSSTSYYSRPGNAYLYITLNTVTSYEVMWKISKARTSGKGALINEYQRAQLNPDNYDNESIYFEVTGYCANNAVKAYLYDGSTNESGTSGSNVTNSDINFNSSSKIRVRTASTISLTNGNRYIFNQVAATNTLEYSAAFVVFKVVGNTAKSVTDTASGSDTPSISVKTTVSDAKTGTSKNLLPSNLANGAESGTVTGLSPSANLTLSADSDNAYSGSYCIKGVSNGAAKNFFLNSADLVPATPSQDWVFSLYIKSVTYYFWFAIVYYDSSKTQIGFVNLDVPNGASYGRKEVSGTTPANTAYVGIYGGSDQDTETWYIDQLQLEKDTLVATAWEDPGTVGGSNFSESLSITQLTSKSVSDSSSGADSLTLEQGVTVSDNLTGTDTPSIRVGFTIQTTGSGTDNPIIKNTFTIPNTSTGGDLVSISNSLSVSDTTSATDTVSNKIVVPILEATLSISESQSLKRFGTITDSLIGSETLALLNHLTGITTPGVASETITLRDTIPVTDTSSGTDTPQIKATPHITDTGSGSETILNIINHLLTSDTGSTVDNIVVSVDIYYSDSLSTVETVTINVGAVVNDTNTSLIEDIIVGGGLLKFISDVAGISENILANKQLGVTDNSSTITETPTLKVAVSQVDTASSTDNVGIMVGTVLLDEVHGADTTSIFLTKEVTDTTTLTDVVQKIDGSMKDLNDSGTVNEEIGLNTIINDVASALDIIHRMIFTDNITAVITITSPSTSGVLNIPLTGSVTNTPTVTGQTRTPGVDITTKTPYTVATTTIT